MTVKRGHFWTLQQFSTVAGKAWLALHEQSDAGIEIQYTGYYDEMQALAARLGVTPDELEPIIEEEFFARWEDEQMP